MPLLLAALALLVRLLHILVAPLPSNDGAHYLAMAEAIARGDGGTAFEAVFHPGWPLVLAPFVWLGVPAYLASELLASLLASASIYVLGKAMLSFREPLPAKGTDWLLLAILAVSSLSIRHSGEAYSEALFLCLTSLFAWLVLVDRPRSAALPLGLAYWVRPEAAAIGLFLLARGRRWKLAAILAIGIALGYPLFRHTLTGLPFELSPKLGFYETMVEGRPGVLGNLARFPLAALRGTEFLILPLAVLGLPSLWRRDRRLCFFSALPVFALFVAMLLLQVKPRFFHSLWPLLFLLALGTRAERPSFRRVLRYMLLLVLVWNAVRLSKDLFDPPRIDKLPEQSLGLALRAGARDLLPSGRVLEEGELVTDLPRVAYYAGHMPPEPFEYSLRTLEPLARVPGVRIVVLGRKREGREELARRLSGLYERVPLPERLRSAPGGDRLLVLRRK